MPGDPGLMSHHWKRSWVQSPTIAFLDVVDAEEVKGVCGSVSWMKGGGCGVVRVW